MDKAKNQVTHSDTGRRVTFQFILPNGHVSEAVGTFEYFDDGAKTYMVRNKHGELVRVPMRDVTHGKIVS
jgi:hypothetical protein